MDIGTALFVFGFVFSSLLLLVIGFKEVWNDVTRWRDSQIPDPVYLAPLYKEQTPPAPAFIVMRNAKRI